MDNFLSSEVSLDGFGITFCDLILVYVIGPVHDACLEFISLRIGLNGWIS